RGPPAWAEAGRRGALHYGRLFSTHSAHIHLQTGGGPYTSVHTRVGVGRDANVRNSQYTQRQGAGRTAASAGASIRPARSAGSGAGVFAQSRRGAVVPQSRGGLDYGPG